MNFYNYIFSIYKNMRDTRVAHSRVAASRAVPHFLAHAPLLCILGLVRLIAANVIIPSRDLTCFHVVLARAECGFMASRK